MRLRVDSRLHLFSAAMEIQQLKRALSGIYIFLITERRLFLFCNLGTINTLRIELTLNHVFTVDY
jgi:hypothetical protein